MSVQFDYPNVKLLSEKNGERKKREAVIIPTPPPNE